MVDETGYLGELEDIADSGLTAADTFSVTFNMDICAGCGPGTWAIDQQASGVQQGSAPEPGVLLLSGGGLVILGLWRWRRARDHSETVEGSASGRPEGETK